MKYGQKIVNININDTVSVRLTDYGRAVYNDFESQYPEQHRTPLVEIQGTYKTEMWDLMQKFGPQMYMGNDQLFENNLIAVEVL